MKANLQAGLNTAATIANCFEISPITGMPTIKPQVAAAIGQALSDKWNSMDRNQKLEFAGRGLFEVASLAIAPAKLAKLAKLDKVADGARLLDKAGDAAKGINNVLDSGKAAAATLRVGDKAPILKMNLQLFGKGGLADDAIKGGAKTETRALQTYYPPNDGALGNTEKMFLMPGDKIDRFGKMGGKYFAPAGTPLEMRALPHNADLSQYREFEVLKPFEVEGSTIAPYFNQIGLGKQFKSPVSAEILEKRGIIKIIDGGK